MATVKTATPKRRQTETATNQKGDKWSKRRQMVETATNQNGDSLHQEKYFRLGRVIGRRPQDSPPHLCGDL